MEEPVTFAGGKLVEVAMQRPHVVVLGSRFAGLEAASRLHAEVGDQPGWSWYPTSTSSWRGLCGLSSTGRGIGRTGPRLVAPRWPPRTGWPIRLRRSAPVELVNRALDEIRAVAAEKSAVLPGANARAVAALASTSGECYSAG